MGAPAFDMQCPPDQRMLTVLDPFSGGQARQVDVSGSGQRVVDVDPAGNFRWIAYSERR